ncbi:MAG: trypsin-like peptidase domain-containing protein [Verrucomicrobiota bacterium]|nr:trypsin-like peptidase domain-containing protein [Verrucomicrobiota bacterium]
MKFVKLSIVSLFFFMTQFCFATGSVRITPLVKAVSKVLPSVVNIGTESIIPINDRFNLFFNDFFGVHRRYYKTSSLGSGVIIHDAGLVLTNDHVVSRASRISVTLHNGKTYDAVKIAGNSENDLALLKLINLPKNITIHAIEFALPGDLMLGEPVVTVGNPFGLGHTITSGVLSAKNRNIIEHDEVLFDDILQTDAAINPGNSGGPLINLDGKLIGINLAIRPDSQGIGFAIPTERVEEILAEFLLPFKFGKRSCGFIPETIIDAEGKSYVKVKKVFSGSPTERVGVKAGMIIREIARTKVNQAIDVSRILWDKRNDTKIKILFDEAGLISLKMDELSDDDISRCRLGAEFQEIIPRLAEALGLPENFPGLIITDIMPESPLLKGHLSQSDIIIKIGNVEINSLEKLGEILNKIPSQEKIRILGFRILDIRNKMYLKKIYFETTLN